MKTQRILWKKAIIFHLFDFEPRMTDFVFERRSRPALRESPEILIEDSWDLHPEEQILVRAALDIWSGTGNVFLWELLNSLSEPSFRRLISAANKYREQSRCPTSILAQEGSKNVRK